MRTEAAKPADQTEGFDLYIASPDETFIAVCRHSSAVYQKAWGKFTMANEPAAKREGWSERAVRLTQDEALDFLSFHILPRTSADWCKAKHAEGAARWETYLIARQPAPQAFGEAA